jgi:hypothetical protein
MRSFMKQKILKIKREFSKDQYSAFAIFGILYTHIVLTLVFWLMIEVVIEIGSRLDFDTFNIIVLRVGITCAYLFYAVIGYRQIKLHVKILKKHFIAMKRLKRIKKNPYLGFDNVPIAEGKKK